MSFSFRDWINSNKQSLKKATEGWDSVEVSAVLTLSLLILLHVDEVWYIRTPIVSLCIIALVRPSLYRGASLWFALALILAVKHTGIWYDMNNHEYLINYWCLALGLSFLTLDPRRAIALNARILIGLAFLFATLWKAISKDYLDGSFFHYLLLSDGHFKYIARSIGGLSGEAFGQNLQAVSAVAESNSPNPIAQLQSTPIMPLIANILTWWTILIEGLVAVAFLWPGKRVLSRLRDVPLLIFLLSTYMMTPIVGFGWILAAIGVAQCNPRLRYGPFLYVLCFILIEIFSTPWKDLLARLL